jgi:glycosyltransferase involved in cell wall biosynthesis
MRITFLCPHCEICGGVKVIFRFADHLARLGHRTTVLLNRYTNRYQHWFGNPTNFKIYQFTGEKSIPPSDCIVNFGDNRYFGTKVPHVLFLQGIGLSPPIEKRHLNEYKYAGYITVSQWLADLVKDKGQTFIVPPGVDYKYRKEQPLKVLGKKIVIGGLYHSINFKNFDLFLNTLAILRSSGMDVIGYALSANGVRERDKYMKLNVIFEVNPKQEILPKFYSSCSYWISTSRNEGFGLTPLEAMACGVPVVWYPNRGLEAHLEHGKNCMIANNPEDAARYIIEISKNSNIRNNLVDNGKKLSASFNWENSATLFSKALKEILR